MSAEVNITNEEALSILKLVPQSGTAFASAFKGTLINSFSFFQPRLSNSP